MKVGDYVRTKDGLIRKIVEIDKLIYIDKDYISDEPEYHNSLIEEDIIKSSPKIIDLIEVGDYVNGCLVLHKENNELVCGLLLRYKEEDIQNVVTKEQFESIQYKVGD